MTHPRRFFVANLLFALAAAHVDAAGDATRDAPAAEPEYEMTTYYVGFLSRGPTWAPEITDEVRRIQEGHMAHIGAMAKSGKLLLAGPFTDGGTLRGMFVFQTASEEEARAFGNRGREEDFARKVRDRLAPSGRRHLEGRPRHRQPRTRPHALSGGARGSRRGAPGGAGVES